MNRQWRTPAIVALLFMAIGCRAGSERASDDHHGHGDGGHGREDTAAEPAKGPHGGRLLRDGSLALEVTIFELGVPPECRVYAYDNDEPMDPDDVKLAITLRRFGGRVDTIRFAKRGNYLLGDTTVEEPHSFDVEVVAEHDGRARRWTYASYEGRTEMSPAAIASSGIEIETIGPATIRTTIPAHGRIVPNGDRLAHIAPRYTGIVRDVRARLGDTVAAGQVLAVVENNESLQPYDVKAAIAGTVIGKDVLPGELARDADVIFTIADLATVWVDLNLPPEAAERVRVSQTVAIAGTSDTASAEGRIVYISPIGAASTQTRVARVELSNAAGQWTPGLYVTGDVLVAETTVPTAVKTAGLQTFRDRDVIFLNEGTVFQAMPVELGRRDAEWAEVTEGVTAGQRYATENSFIVKADVGKSGASHDH